MHKAHPMQIVNRIFYLLLLAFLGSCSSTFLISDVETEENISIDSKIASDPLYDQVIAPYKEELNAQMNEVIGFSKQELTKKGDDSSLGLVFADYTLDAAKKWAEGQDLEIHASVINIGGLRTTIGQGDVKLMHLYEVMPFENELVIVQLTGAQLQSLFDYYRNNLKNNPVSGLLIETDGNRLIQGLINGKEPVPVAIYNIATSDYLALGGDQMNFFAQGKLIPTGVKLRDAYIEQVRKNPTITVPQDKRLLFHNKPDND